MSEFFFWQPYSSPIIDEHFGIQTYGWSLLKEENQQIIAKVDKKKNESIKKL